MIIRKKGEGLPYSALRPETDERTTQGGFGKYE